MEDLKNRLDELINRLADPGDLRSKLSELVSIYPFSEYEYVISHLLTAKKRILSKTAG
jgi:hypothetical protein